MTAIGDVARRPSLGPFPSTAEVGRVLTEVNHGLLRSAFTGQANAILVGRGHALVAHRRLLLNPFRFRRAQARVLGLGRAERRSWGKERRVCQAVRIRRDERTLLVGNLHATSSEDKRLPDVELLRAAVFVDGLAQPGEPIVLGGDFNVAPEDVDVWDPRACHGGTHVSKPERDAFARLCSLGLVDAYRLRHSEPGRYTWWDYRAGNFHKNFGMRIDHLLVSAPLKPRVVWAEIDREARKGKPIPSDHAPLVVDIDAPGCTFDAGWMSADERIAERRARPG